VTKIWGLSKRDAKYGPAPAPEVRCDNCKFMFAPLSLGGCRLVRGVISGRRVAKSSCRGAPEASRPDVRRHSTEHLPATERLSRRGSEDRDQKFAEPVALSSTQPTGRPALRRAFRLSLDLIALRARRRREPKRSCGGIREASWRTSFTTWSVTGRASSEPRSAASPLTGRSSPAAPAGLRRA
jgi:hypothetical protein